MSSLMEEAGESATRFSSTECQNSVQSRTPAWASAGTREPKTVDQGGDDKWFLASKAPTVTLM